MRSVILGWWMLAQLTVQSQQVQYQHFDAVERLLTAEADTTYVINLWATWCKPCVEELPYFNAVDSALAGTAVRVILLSLDAQSRWETALLPFLQAHPMRAEVWALYPERPSDWIDRIAPEWSGAIPGTLFLNGKTGKRIFIGSELTQADILQHIQNVQTQN